MKLAVFSLVLLLSTFASAQTALQPQASACPDRADLQEELKDAKALVARMQNRVITMRNSAGTVNDFEVRNALQVNADAWQDLVDDLKNRLDRLQTRIDRCDARDKIQSAKPK
jgi:hypothetical protein